MDKKYNNLSLSINSSTIKKAPKNFMLKKELIADKILMGPFSPGSIKSSSIPRGKQKLNDVLLGSRLSPVSHRRNDGSLNLPRFREGKEKVTINTPTNVLQFSICFKLLKINYTPPYNKRCMSRTTIL
ncbi:unnamed protein product [Moneuplotes crassus]|uniref:Uncharacterized protein n=1 Tax=Euplotes crassus TaxID=5936 RepID=A0AAD1UDE6_EUPCR|nr:unnamed protein product [Moneuplotes crassus]